MTIRKTEAARPVVRKTRTEVAAAAETVKKKGWEAKSVRRSEKKPAAAKASAVKAIPKSEAGQYDYYSDVIDRSGGRFRTGPEQRNILSFRTQTSTKANAGQGRYDDTTVMLWKDAGGHKHVRTYHSNTEPTSHYEGTYGQDANRDGRLDLGRIPAGTYDYARSYSSKLGNVLRPTSDFNVQRDTNHDGTFNDGAMTGGGGSMLFHAGGSSFTGSAGCQTMAPADYQRFWNDLGSYKGAISYTVVNGSTATGTAKVESPRETFSKTGLSYEQLHAIMPQCPPERAKQLLPYLNHAMKEFNIDSPKRAAAFLAQLAHESGQLKYFEELASGSAYEGRKDLGNTHPGDGVRFKGRGPIQLTGRANYERAGKALGVDLIAHPELAARPDIGFRIAGWFWKGHGLNELADKGEFRDITRRINGGYNGLAARESYWSTAKRVLGDGFKGGPLSDGEVGGNVPGSFNRSGHSGESSGGRRVGPRGNYDGNSFDSYGGRTRNPGITDPAAAAASSIGADPWNMFMLLMMLMELIESMGGELPPGLLNSPAFAEFVRGQPGLADWQPGQKVPEEVTAAFLSGELATRGKVEGGGDDGLDAAFDQLEQELSPATENALAFTRQISG
jgi:predicted chitinase